MKLFLKLIQVGFLYLFYLVGEVVQHYFHLPIPGSIVGLLLLFLFLCLKWIPVQWIEEGASVLLAYLPLFFIPATVGVVDHLDIFSGRGAILIAVLVFSSILTIASAGRVSQFLAEWILKRRERH